MRLLMLIPDLPPAERLVETTLEDLLAADDGLREEWEDNPHALRVLERGETHITGGGASPLVFMRRIAG